MSDSTDKQIATDTDKQMAPAYDYRAAEEKWYRFWENNGYFAAHVNPDKEPFSIVIPPPNITGKLHMGHAMDETMQDIIVRWKRMSGFETLWLPGTDHASIATEAKVVEMLAKEGLTKTEIGREAFLERVWEWKRQYGGTIVNQLKRLGSSCDWSRERFTMDEGCSRAVREVFVRLYEKGLIYRGDYMVNWCPVCQTNISDVEVEHEEEEGSLWYLRYPLADGDADGNADDDADGTGAIIVATTRPETMLGDTAVAVNPADERYRKLIGKTVLLPIMNRPIPVIADEYVDMDFGTGAVKITPAHDPNDFEMGLRHQLPKIAVIGEDGRMTAAAGKYAGQDRLECRKGIIAELEAAGLLEKTETHVHNVGHCYRCDSSVEPLISKQWFVKMEPLAKPAIDIVKNGAVEFIPERFTKIYLNWMENIRDWCISRQLWWGHRIPAWYCGDCGAVIVARDAPQTCGTCGSSNLTQDQDVLDTWFSSALWPFSTLGWPDQTPELEYFYPTSVLVTGRDIIFFWVARMIFMALEFMEEPPFAKVIMHGLVLDHDGKKMSKSRGNAIDPLEEIEEFGTDALRLAMITGNTPGSDFRYQKGKIEGYRNFANKLWNASRFVLLNLDDERLSLSDFKGSFTLPDRWILSRYNNTAAEVQRLLERFDLGMAAQTLYDFVWNEYCDWYIEMAKPRLRSSEPSERRTVQAVLRHVLQGTLELLHPFIPFITEEIWQKLPGNSGSIMIAPWPQADPGLIDAKAEKEIGALMDIIRAIRNVRAEMNVPPAKKVEAICQADPEKGQLIDTNRILLQTLGGLSTITVIQEDAPKPEKAAAAVAGGISLFLPLAGMIDLTKEVERLEKEYHQMQGLCAGVEAKLSNAGFLAKAPAEVVSKEQEKLAGYREKALKLKERLDALKG